MNLLSQKNTKESFLFSKETFEKVLAFLVCLFPVSLLAGKSASDIVISTSVVLFLFSSWKTKNWGWASKPWVQVLMLLWGYMVLRSIWTSHPADAFKTALPYGRYFLFAALLSSLPFQKGTYHKALLWIFMALILFIDIDTLVQWIYKKDLLGRPSTYGWRLTGPFNRPLVGVYLSWISFPIVCTFLYKTLHNSHYSFKKRAAFFSLSFTLSLLSLLTIYASGERTALLGTFLSYGLLFLFIRSFKICLFILGVIVFFSMAIHIKHMDIPTAEGTHITKQKKISINSIYNSIRAEIKLKKTSSRSNYKMQGGYGPLFRDALRFSRESFIFGIGPNQFAHKCNVNLDPSGKSTHCIYRHPHNIWLNVLSSLGLIGFSLFASFFFLLFRKTAQNWGAVKTNGLALGLLCVVIYRFFPIAGGMSIFLNNNAHIIWFLIGWLLCLLEKPNNYLAKTSTKA